MKQFKLNEPTKRIPGGSNRPSKKINLKNFPAINRRIQLNHLLLIHDPEVFEHSRKKIQIDDLPILRLMARETVITGNEPIIRRNAVLMIGYFPTPENLNTLLELAQYGEDEYTRATALTSLANSDVLLVLPVLREGLEKKNIIEFQHAKQGLIHIGKKIGPHKIQELLKGERRKKIRNEINNILRHLEGKEVKSRKKRQSTFED